MLNLYCIFIYTVLGTLFVVYVHNISYDKCKIQKQAVNSEKKKSALCDCDTIVTNLILT